MRALKNPALRRWGAVSTLLPLLAEAWMTSLWVIKLECLINVNNRYSMLLGLARL